MAPREIVEWKRNFLKNVDFSIVALEAQVQTLAIAYLHSAKSFAVE